MADLPELTCEDFFVDPGADWNCAVRQCIEQTSPLNTQQQALARALRFEGDAMNGGIGQYFHNTGGVEAFETVAALRTINALQSAEILETALGRWTASQGDATFSDIDDRFFALDKPTSSERLFDFMMKFVSANEPSFFERRPVTSPDDDIYVALADPSQPQQKRREFLALLLSHKRLGVQMRAAVLLWPYDRASAEPVLEAVVAKRERGLNETMFADSHLDRLRAEKTN